MKFIVGKKLDMSQVWQGDKVEAVTIVQADPCMVVQVKNKEKDGYEAVQIGFGEKKEKNIKKPQKGHIKKAIKQENPKAGQARYRAGKKINFRYLREFRLYKNDNKGKIDVKQGDVIDVSTFKAGDKIKVTGVSKGKGFQGVVKRHGFHGQSKTHGTKDQLRMSGSIGATGPAHVFKGQKMSGRMGGDRVTVVNLEIMDIDKENNMLLIKGAVPGARNGLVLISGEGELKVASQLPTGDSLPQETEKQIKEKEEKTNENIEEVVIEADKKKQASEKK